VFAAPGPHEVDLLTQFELAYDGKLLGYSEGSAGAADTARNEAHAVRASSGWPSSAAPVTLLCASDDGSKTLFPEDRPLLQVDLPHKLDGGPVTDHVTSLFGLPQRSVCTGTFETEGVHYDTVRGTLRAEVVQPGVCAVATTVYSYRRP
jgi:hypothetical protein